MLIEVVCFAATSEAQLEAASAETRRSADSFLPFRHLTSCSVQVKRDMLQISITSFKNETAKRAGFEMLKKTPKNNNEFQGLPVITGH